MTGHSVAKGTGRGPSLVAGVESIARRCTGRVALAARNLTTGEEIAYNAGEVLPTASVIKLAILAELYRRVVEEDLDLDRRVVVEPAGMVGGTGVLRLLRPGLEPCVRDLAMLMVVASDNVATNMLVDLVGGVDAVNATMHERLSLHTIRLNRKVRFLGHRHDVPLGEASAGDLVGLVEMIAADRLWSAQACADMTTMMGHQLYLDHFPRYFRYAPFAYELGVRETMRVACKTGLSVNGVRTDAGIVQLPDRTRIVYAAATAGCRGDSGAHEDEGAVTNGLLGRLVVSHWCKEQDVEDLLVPLPYEFEVM